LNDEVPKRERGALEIAGHFERMDEDNETHITSAMPSFFSINFSLKPPFNRG
jgi:hypothetical protein